MRLNACSKWIGLAAMLALSSALGAPKPSSTSAEFYKLHPELYADKQITLEVCFVKAFDRKTPVPELRFFHAMTFDTKNGVPGGPITVVIPAGDVDKLVKKYGSFPEGGRRINWDSQKLKGIFRIGERGHYYVDVSGEAAELLKGHEVPDEAGPPMEGPLEMHPPKS